MIRGGFQASAWLDLNVCTRAQLTTAVFTAAFEPVKKQLEKTART